MMYINAGISAETNYMLTICFLSSECPGVKLKLSKVDKGIFDIIGDKMWSSSYRGLQWGNKINDNDIIIH